MRVEKDFEDLLGLFNKNGVKDCILGPFAFHARPYMVTSCKEKITKEQQPEPRRSALYGSRQNRDKIKLEPWVLKTI